MNRHFTAWFATASLAFAFVLLYSAPAPGADAPVAAAEVKNAQPAAQEERKKQKEGTDLLRERSIYIPYTKLQRIFEKKGRGVFLPYEDFLELWDAARQSRQPSRDPVPPANFIITGAENVATISEDVVTVVCKMRLEVLTAGWHEVPLRLGDAALTRAELDGMPARIVPTKGAGYNLLIEKHDDQPRVAQLILEFAKAHSKSLGRNSVSFQPPLVPVSRWEVHIPASGVKVNIHPALATTEAPGKASKTATHVLAFIGAAPTVRIDWTPEAGGAKGLASLANVQTETEIRIDEGVTRTRTSLAYAISRATLAQLVVQVPVGQRVVNVFDPNVREWSVGTDEQSKVQTITAELFEAAGETQKLQVEMECFAGEDQNEVEVPQVKAVGVGRQQGVIVVRVAEALGAEATERSNLVQLDPGELSGRLARQKWTFSYRYTALPFRLALKVEKVRPHVLLESLLTVHLQPEELTAELLGIYEISRAGVFHFEFLIPPGYDVRQVHGGVVADAQPAAVSSYHVSEGTKYNRLHVNLSRKAEGNVALAVQLHRSLREPDLLAPTGNAASIEVPIPRADSATVARENGKLSIYAPEGIRVNPQTVQGLRAVSNQEALRVVLPAQEGLSSARPVLAFAYAGAETQLVLSAERRKPHTTVRQLLLAQFDSGVTTYRATFSFDIQYSAIASLRIDIPENLTNEVRVTTPGIRHTVDQDVDSLPDLLPGYVPWVLSAETELAGTGEIVLTWEHGMDTLDIGKGVLVDIPRLIPRKTDRSWGQIVLAKAESIDVVPAGQHQGLRAIDPRHDLMQGMQVADASRAFEYHDDWGLAVQATRYEVKDVKATSIERGLVRMVVTRGDVTSVQAIYRMRSARQRLVIGLPQDAAFDAQPLRINGRPVTLEQGEKGEYFVPLAGQDPDEAFLVELRYTIPGTGMLLQCPEFPGEPAHQQVYLSVFLPREKAYLGSSGPWTEELAWVMQGLTAVPRGNWNSDWLISWVTSGLSVSHQAGLKTFPTDGRALLFSTLRPPAGEGGALRVWAVREWGLKLVLIIVVLAVGIWLLRASAGRRAIALGALLTATAFMGVFFPSCLRAIISNATAAGVFAVLVLWTLHHLLVTRPRDPAVQARKRTDHPPPTPPDTGVEDEEQPEEQLTEPAAARDDEHEEDENGGGSNA